MRIFALTLLISAFSFPAFAAERLPQCKKAPESIEMPTNPDLDYKCDIFTRQFIYATKQRQLASKMKERANNYAAKRQASYATYLQNLDAYHASLVQ